MMTYDDAMNAQITKENLLEIAKISGFLASEIKNEKYLGEYIRANEPFESHSPKLGIWCLIPQSMENHHIENILENNPYLESKEYFNSSANQNIFKNQRCNKDIQIEIKGLLDSEEELPLEPLEISGF